MKFITLTLFSHTTMSGPTGLKVMIATKRIISITEKIDHSSSYVDRPGEPYTDIKVDDGGTPDIISVTETAAEIAKLLA